jgi:hypothetical protein
MARQKKEDTGELLVNIEQFTRTRDSVCSVQRLRFLFFLCCDAPSSSMATHWHRRVTPCTSFFLHFILRDASRPDRNRYATQT